MKKRLLAAALSLLTYASPSFAQEQVAPLTGSVIIGQPAPIVSYDAGSPSANAPRGWVSAEYLHWWMTNGPIGVPLVTTGNPASPNGGAIGDPGTVVLFGNSSVNFGGFDGGRVSMGYWFDCDSLFGMEASGFGFSRRSNTFSVNSDAAGNPLLAAPFQTPAGVESRQIASTPLPLGFPTTGGFAVNTTSQLWGADLNGAVNLYRACNLSIDLLAGFRYYDLQEGLRIDGNTSFMIPDPNIRAAVVLIPVKATSFDTFSTRNQFYGGQVGTRGAYTTGRFSTEFLGMLAMGTTEHTLYTGGATVATLGGVQVPTPPGGFYTKPSNTGTFHTSSFSVVPQLQVKLGYDVTNHLRATIGYDAMYWSQVNRPGNEIDHVIGAQPGTRPMPLDNHSNLWAHGFSAGLEFRW